LIKLTEILVRSAPRTPMLPNKLLLPAASETRFSRTRGISSRNYEE